MSRHPARRASWKTASALCLVVLAPSLHAGSLSDIWQAVAAHSPEAASAMFAQEAGQHRLEQAKALWRPQVNLGFGAGQMTANSQMTGAQFVAPGFGASNSVDFGSSIRQGHASNWVLEIQQPLINAQLKSQSAQLQTSAQVAELAHAKALNTLMLATVQQFFQWLTLEQQSSALHRQWLAVHNLSEQAQERFTVGDVAVTDMLEANAQAQALEVQKNQLSQQIRNTEKVLTDATGWSLSQLRQMGTALTTMRTDGPQDLNTLQQLARNQNLDIQMLKAQLDLEQEKSKAHRWQAQPSLALWAKTTQQRLDGHGDEAGSTLYNRQQYVGLQLSVPLYAGGYTSAKLSESLQHIEKLQMDIQAAQLQVEQAVQTQWLRWQSHDQDLKSALALKEAHQKRLQATQLAYEVGDRSLPDLLRAQADLTQAEVSVYQQRLNVLLTQLSLFALQGPMGLNELQTLDAQFKLN